MNEAVRITFDYMGWDSEEINYMMDKLEGVRHRAADTTRAKELLGWEPEYTVEEGIKNTLDWYVNNREQECVRENLETVLHER